MRKLGCVITVTLFSAIMLSFPKATFADCIPCLKGHYHNHGTRGWKHKPHIIKPKHKPTRLELLAERREKASRIALHYVGTPYRWGGASPGGFDCSGLVQYAMGKVGIHVPHSSWALLHLGVSVERNQIKAGDVLVFNYGGHVGLALNNHAYVESPHSGATVRVKTLVRHLYAARRIISVY